MKKRPFTTASDIAADLAKNVETLTHAIVVVKDETGNMNIGIAGSLKDGHDFLGILRAVLAYTDENCGPRTHQHGTLDGLPYDLDGILKTKGEN